MLRIPPTHLLACPNCQSGPDEGFIPAEQRCENCGLVLFDLNGLPCWFSSGAEQRAVWQDLFAKILAQGKENLAKYNHYDPRLLTPSSVARLKTQKQSDEALIASIETLLRDIGLQPQLNPKYSAHDAGHMLEYYELLLRDWAWDTQSTLRSDTETQENQPTATENEQAFLRIQNALSASQHQLGDVWVMGCGAGRLSVDIHTKLDAKSTIALDANLILIAAAHRLAGQRLSWQLSQSNPYPQLGFDNHKTWHIPRMDRDNDTLKNWFALAGDAWNPPLQPESFDTIITPWFIDVNGKEPAALIGLVQKYLKPGGLWINSGPLLYSASLDHSQQLHHDEILQLLGLASFSILFQDTATSTYLNSPLNAQQRTEQVWTFAAQAPTEDEQRTIQNLPSNSAETPYPWMILPHLPIPKDTPLSTHNNPVLEQLASLVDGTRSINSIADIMRPNLGEGKDPLKVVRSAFLEYLLT